jgi:cytochrome c peroxidase
MSLSMRAALGAFLLFCACESSEPNVEVAVVRRPRTRGEPLEPLPHQVDVHQGRAALGEKLFSDPTLSTNGKIACVTCHLYEHGGAEPEPLSATVSGERTHFNTPSIFNVAFNFRFSWTGAFNDIESQLDQAFARTMGVDIPRVVERLAQRGYEAEFAHEYPDGLTAHNVRDALAQFVRSAVTPDSRFDRFLRGDEQAIDEQERRGYELFKDLGCASCHQGANVGGNLFQRMGVAEDYFQSRGTPISEADQGRFTVTHDLADKHVFRVPSLRNVERTAPYFHDGSARTLDDAIVTMARFQLGREVPSEDRKLIAAFLRTLTGTYRGRAL